MNELWGASNIPVTGSGLFDDKSLLYLENLVGARDAKKMFLQHLRQQWALRIQLDATRIRPGSLRT